MRENAKYSHQASVSPAPDNRNFVSRGGGTLASGGVGVGVGFALISNPAGWVALAGGLILAGGIALMGVGSAQLVVSYSGNSSARHDDEVTAAALKGQAMSFGPGAVMGAAMGAGVTRSEEGALAGAAIGGLLELGIGVGSWLRARSAGRATTAAEGGGFKTSPGVTVRKVGNYFVKEVDQEPGALGQWYGRRSLRYQAEALGKLGDMAPSHLLRNGKLITRDAGTYTPGSFWKTWLEGSKRLGAPMNDIRPRNIGANGVIFDPALDPIVRGVYWAVPSTVLGGGATVGYMMGKEE